MAKKDFTGMTTGRVYGAIDQATKGKGEQGTASPEEARERAGKLQTQGRKGCKATRINMAFTPENHEFIKVLAKATGNSMTQFTNLVVAAYRNEHPELMAKANDFLATVNSGVFSSLLNQRIGHEEATKEEPEAEEPAADAEEPAEDAQ